jgi:hypothetical protein
MSALYMDRVAPFDLARVTNAVLTLIQGARARQGWPWTQVNELSPDNQPTSHKPCSTTALISPAECRP